MNQDPKDKDKNQDEELLDDNGGWPDSESISRCCESGCDNCPWGYNLKTDPSIPPEFQNKTEDEIPEEYQKYLEEN